MTTTARKPLLAHDPAVPQRDVLLDPERLAARLQDVLGYSVSRVERLRAKYRLGEGLRILVRAEFGGQKRLIAARSFPRERLSREFVRANKRRLSTTGPSVVCDEETSALFWTLPSDRRLGDLDRVLFTPEGLVPALGGHWMASRVAAWSPERCLTVACLDHLGGEMAFAKCYPTTADAHRVVGLYETVHRLARRDPSLRVPRVIGWSPRHRVVVFERVDGRPPQAASGAAALGDAIARLHTLGPTTLPEFGRLRPARLKRSTEIIGLALPKFGTLAADAWTALSGGPGHRAGRPTLLHGDVHHGNVLVGPAGATLIDLDQAGAGPPETDLASALARATRDLVVGRISEAEHGAVQSGLLDAYSAVARLPDAQSLRWHTAACLVAEGGLRAVNRVRVDAIPHVGEILRRAISLAEGARD